MSELLVRGSCLGKDAAFKATHVEKEVGIVLGIDGDKRVLPLHSGDGPRQPVLDVPEHCSVGSGDRRRWEGGEDRARLPAQVDVMFHQPHASISGPTLLVVVAHNVLIVGVRVLGEVALDQLSSLLSCKPTRGDREGYYMYMYMHMHH